MIGLMVVVLMSWCGISLRMANMVLVLLRLGPIPANGYRI